ncbi:hypothetical protein G7Y89_g14009 [Cudoniella acicularis]|uniref:BRCT domain-containing protein n=1 Tax=Cudoniella acicularis TaxID=354080 RepID=A0A8H4VY47_9HELO|nr:hypothetical protein G7Y89_g14009 [Cudoniella acicularis]
MTFVAVSIIVCEVFREVISPLGDEGLERQDLGNNNKRQGRLNLKVISSHVTYDKASTSTRDDASSKKRHEDAEIHQTLSGTMANADRYMSSRTVALNGLSDGTAPLEGLVICCTSVPEEKRTQFAEYAVQMGAIHTLDLTLDVTHLIVGDYNTPKYRYVAKERPDVKPMTTKFIEAARELWINDQEIDLESLEKEHLLPTLHSLKFSMTGCDNPEERLEIAEQVKANGAAYEGDLTRHITHLISFRTEGAKYKAAKTWRIRIVSIEWLRDSLERGMILDEKLYDPVLPLEERGKNAWDKTKPKRTSLGKRSRDENSTGTEAGKRKLRRTASAKLNSQSERIWGDIVGAGNFTEVARSGVWETSDEPTQPNEPSDPKKQKQQPEISIRQPLEEIKQEIGGIFSGCLFYLHGFEAKKTQVLCDHLLPHGAEVTDTLEPGKNRPINLFIIVPHDLPISEYPNPPQHEASVETVTVWWVERCLHHKKFMAPSEHIVGRPFSIFPIEGFASMTISSSAFTGIDLLHVKKVVELLGAKYSEDMTPHSSVLVTKSMAGLRKDKYDHAQEWNVPIVKANWLWDCIEAGSRLPLQKYRCRSQKRKDSLPDTARASSRRSQSRDPRRDDRSQTAEANKTLSRADSVSSKQAAKPAASSGMDNSAFAVEESESVPVKEEEDSLNVLPVDDAPDPTAQTEDLSYKSEPLSERDINSSSRTVSTAPAPSGHPIPKPPPHQEDLGNVISDLLAKTKSSVQPSNSEAPEGRRRGTNRILGRVTSNISTTSTSHSRATSVDSTATHGHPVEYPPYNTNTKANAANPTNDDLEMLLNGDKNIRKNNTDSQPPLTQLQYEDPDSNEVTERVMARMKGEKLPKRSGTREKALTISDLGQQHTTRSTRTSRTLGFR